MIEQGAAALFVVGAWWLSTGLVLRLVWLGPRTHRRSLALVSALSLAGLGAIAWSAREPTVTGAYVSFAGALLVWAWHELTFLLGVVTGPRRAPCPPEATGWTRFRLAAATLIHHELLLAASVLALVLTTRGAPNQVAAQTLVALWALRLSAKLNVFLGVRSFAEELVPERLHYLLGYFRRDRLSPLMPASFVLAGGFAGLAFRAAFATDASPFVAAGQTMVASLLLLGLLEHLFLTLPLPDAALWRWAARPQPPLGPTLQEEGS